MWQHLPGSRRNKTDLVLKIIASLCLNLPGVLWAEWTPPPPIPNPYVTVLTFSVAGERACGEITKAEWGPKGGSSLTELVPLQGEEEMKRQYSSLPLPPLPSSPPLPPSIPPSSPRHTYREDCARILGGDYLQARQKALSRNWIC